MALDETDATRVSSSSVEDDEPQMTPVLGESEDEESENASGVDASPYDSSDDSLDDSSDSLMDSIKDKPCHVYDVVVRGNDRTREYVILHQLETAKKAKTFEELHLALEEARHGLMELGIFESVEIEADEGPTDIADTANVYVTVKESTGTAGTLGTYFQGHEQTVEAQGSLKNKLGHGETVEAQLAYGQESSSNFSLGLHWPHVRGSRGHLRKRFEYLWRCWKRHSSHTQGMRGFSVEYGYGSHTLGYELAWRQNKDSTGASPAIRRMLGHSLLSGLKYSFHLERRDSALRPTRGYSLSASTQIAGVGPDSLFVRFLKQDVEAKAAVPLGIFNAALTGSLQAGVLLPWSTTGQPSLINDRFFVDGPRALRGFRNRGIGPTDLRPEEKGRDRLGGDIMVAATAGLSFDLPIKILKKFGVHGHTFACAANLLPLSSASGIRQAPWDFAKSFRDSMRYSAGLGIVIPTILGRLEVNYCFILRKQEFDRTVTRGIQFGLSVPAP